VQTRTTRPNQFLTSRLKKFVHIGGAVVAVLATAAVVYQLSEDNRYMEVATALREKSLNMLALCALCALLNGLLCYGWALICRACNADLAARTAALLFARTHIYRYLPSNLLHFVSRHAALKASGTSHTGALLINTLEVGTQILSAAVLAIVLWLLLPTNPWQLPAATGALKIALPLLALFGVALLAIVIQRQRLAQLRLLAGCLLIYLLFFAGSGLIAAQLSTANSAQLPTIVFVVTIAWLGGALVPGASAGLGIRELLLVSGLTPQLGAADALTLALGFRLITIGGDLLLTLLSWVIPATKN